MDSDGRELLDSRLPVYKSFLKDKGMLCESYIKIGRYASHHGYRLMKELLKEIKLPTAIFAANDSLAIGCYRAIQESGLRIPEDISVIGFNDISIARYLSPPLTTVHIHTNFMGQRAVQMLAELIRQERQIHIHVSVSTDLVVRESVCKAEE